MAIYYQNPTQAAKASIIWLHGLGANAADMQSVVQQVPHWRLHLRHVFVDAPVRPVTLNNGFAMRAWYDVYALKTGTPEDVTGIMASRTLLNDLIEQEIEAGYQSNQIILAGFSQGGAMALYTALHSLYPLKGVVSLSAYLPLMSQCSAILPKETPIFLAAGERDTVVLPLWTASSADWLKNADYKAVTFHSYPMEHSICYEEISDLNQWLNALLKEEEE